VAGAATAAHSVSAHPLVELSTAIVFAGVALLVL
jgi:hypothetical protein